MLQSNLQLLVRGGEAAIGVRVLVAIPALNVAAGAVGLVAARIEVETSTPAALVTGSDGFADLGVGNRRRDRLPGGKRSAINTARGETISLLLLGVRLAQPALGHFTLKTERPELAAVDIGADRGAVNVGRRIELVSLGAIVVLAALILALSGDIGENGIVAVGAVHDIRLDAGGELQRVAADLTINITVQLLLSLVVGAQPALLASIFEAVGPMLAFRGLGAGISTRGVRDRDPLITVLAIVEEASRETIHRHIREKRPLTLATQDGVLADAGRKESINARETKKNSRLHVSKCVDSN